MNMPLVLLNRRRRGFTAFSPSTLFSTTAIGIWLDPSDLSTMFSDRAGTTPVTTPGTVVGLRLDKSKGLVLGAELVANAADRNFSSDTGFWTKEANVTISGGSANWNSATVDFGLVRDGLVSNGKVYEVTFTVSSISSGGIRVWAGAFAPLTATTTGTFTTRIACTANALGRFFFSASATGTTASIDNISVRELAGNHAVAPTDAARPIYGVEPKGGRRNLLTWSERFDVTTDAWAKVASSIGASVTAPNATETAQTLTEDTAATTWHGVSQPWAAPSLSTVTYTTYAKAATRRYVYLQIGDGSAPRKRYSALFDLESGTFVSANSVNSPTGTGYQISSAGNGWHRLSVTMTIAALANGVFLSTGISNTATPTWNSVNYVDYTGDGTSGIYIWGAQLELGSTATAYQRTTTAYDVTESGVATCHYVQYDGSDDSMSTAAIDFTGTDKMSVFAGVRKLSDSAGTIFESSIASGGNNGAILLSNFYSWRSRGTENGDVSSSLAAPTSNVLTGLGDISGDRSTLRINGAQVAQSTTDQGTGNYGNYPLFIGRRNNATLPFNGRDFGIIIVGKAASAGEITATEAWLATKTAEVTI